MGLDMTNLVLLLLPILAVAAASVQLLRQLKSQSTHASGAEDFSGAEPILLHQLKNQIVPYIISAEQLWRFPAYILFALYSYSAAVVAAIAGAGLLPPMLNRIND